MGAEDKLFTLEYDLFCQVRDSHRRTRVVTHPEARPRPLPESTCSASLSAVATRQQLCKAEDQRDRASSISKTAAIRWWSR